VVEDFSSADTLFPQPTVPQMTLCLLSSYASLCMTAAIAGCERAAGSGFGPFEDAVYRTDGVFLVDGVLCGCLPPTNKTALGPTGPVGSQATKKYSQAR
jgi:hypothetical protein